MVVKVQNTAKYCLKISMLVAEMDDDCILRVDFLKLFNLQNVFDSVFLNSEGAVGGKCSRIESFAFTNFSSEISTIFKEGCQHLNDSEEEHFFYFLNEFRDFVWIFVK
ncbi:hypothetical protein ALC62_07031 [Cyphomyrmex costatus]|nr:hypothetical protein ALC62_07031 [Cyphomyrmex costatus]